MKIVVGTRGSKLALTQTKWVIEQLKQVAPNVEFELKIIKTKGDRIQDVALDKIGDKGVFVKEIEDQLLNKTIDLAVHSMKDMPSVSPRGLKFSYSPKREDARDVLILKQGYVGIEDLPKGATIATGSKRRKYQLLALRPDLNIVGIRGNIDTRIRKIKEENLAGVVLAAAGVKRLGLEEKIGYYFPIEAMLPAPAQGALALEIRTEDENLEKMLKKISNLETQLQIAAERTFLAAVEGSCNIPIGAYCDLKDNQAYFKALLGDEEGNKIVTHTLVGDCTTIEEAKNLGEEAAQIIMKELKSL